MANPTGVDAVQAQTTTTVTISEPRIAEVLGKGEVESALEMLLETGISRFSPSAMQMRAMMHMRRGRWADAEKTIKQMMSSQAQPQAASYKMLGDANYLQVHYTEAELCYAKSVTLNALPEAIHDLGVAIVSQGRVAESILHFREACRLAPDRHDFKHHLAIMLVLNSELEEGWDLMKHRMGCPGIVSQFPEPEKYWEGQDLTDKVIVVRSEQGWGDTIQFARYLPELQKTAKKVFFWCQRQMVEFVHANFPGVQAWPNDVPPPKDFDHHINLMCFPRRFPGLYLAPPAKPRSGEGIGVCWFGSPTHKADHLRSVPVERFQRIAEIAGGKLKCLGYGRFEKQPPFMEYFLDHSWNWQQTLELIRGLDLIITVDTAIAHMAGFAGKECWLLLPYVPDFRWGMKGETTPWYDSLKLYRQPNLHDWDSVFAKVEDDLRKRVA